MIYLVTHIAIFLAFALLLGLLLGWLIWGYVAQQRGQEVQSLRERLDDMNMASARFALGSGQHLPLPEVPGVLIEGDLPGTDSIREPFFEEEIFQPEVREPVTQTALKVAHVAPDLEAEVRESRIHFLEQQVRELESARDKLPLLQADLSDAIAGRRAAELRFDEAKNDFEVRASSLLSQIRDFENAAQDWDRQRDELERNDIAREKELATVKAHLRDLQNSQRPQSAEPLTAAGNTLAIELADLRDRYQRTIRERDSIADELEFWKSDARGGETAQLTQRVGELEEAAKIKDITLREQVARIESLLWRVAELEPFAAAAPVMEENLRRQESEIAGHLAMHTDNAEQIQTLRRRVEELETDTSAVDAVKAEMDRLAEQHARELEAAVQRAEALGKTLREHDAESTERIRRLEQQTRELEAASAAALAERHEEHASTLQRMTQEHAVQLADLQQTLLQKQGEIAEHVTAREAHLTLIASLKAGISELEAIAQRVPGLEKSLNDRDTEIRGLLSAHGDMHREMQGWKDYSAQLEPLASQVPVLENTLQEREAEISRLKDAHTEKDSQLSQLKERMSALSARLATHHQRVLELEPIAAKVPELTRREEEARQLMKDTEERHRAEITQLKMNSAQRLRRLRQGITNFKA